MTTLRVLRCTIVGFCLAVAALPAQAQAGTVTGDANAVTYTASPATAADENVTVGVEAGLAVVTSERGATTSSCTPVDANTVTCALAPTFVVNLLGFNDSLTADAVTSPATLEAHGGGGNDRLSGTPNGDRLYGEDGGDTLEGKGGNDLLDAGPGENYLYDGPGDDAVAGGPQQDTFHPGPGRDTFTGGAGGDTIDYGDRVAAVTITLDGVADDGEAGEGDNAGADVETAFGGAGDDRIVAGPVGSELRGGAGNDTITGSREEDRLEGNEGDDTIDARDGRYDSIDCGPGNDVVLADPGDSASNCEVAPDRDGDGTLNEADCRPDDPAVHPGAGEVYGNAIDEDCAGGPGYFRVDATVTYSVIKRKAPPRVRFAYLRLGGIRAGDKIVIRCSGKGCAFKSKQQTGRSGRRTINVAGLFKRRFLRRGAVVEVRILRRGYHGKVTRLEVAKGPEIKVRNLCLRVGATRPGPCPRIP